MEWVTAIWQQFVEGEGWEWVFSGIGVPVVGWLLCRWWKKKSDSTTFTCSGGEQNVAQGDYSVGKLDKITHQVRGNGNLYVINQSPPLNRTIVLILIPVLLFAGFCYWLGPVSSPRDRMGEAINLNNLGTTAYDRGEYDMAWKYLEQSRVIRWEIGDRMDEAITLNNLAATAYAKGEYDTARKYLEQSRVLYREVGDRARAGEGTTLNYLIKNGRAKGDDVSVYLEQLLALYREIGDQSGESITLNILAVTVSAKGKYDTALNYLKQSLKLIRKIGAKADEAVISWKIGLIYIKQGDPTKAEQYMRRAVEIAEEIGYPKLEEWRKALEELRAAL